MADVFLSYARQDRERVERLVHALTAAGWSVFWDPSIVPGTHWDSVIEAELKQAKCVLVVWTPQSVSREWVRIEAHHGCSKGILLPVVLESCEIPITFAHIQAEDLTASSLAADDPSFARMLDGLKRIAGGPAGTTTESASASSADAKPRPRKDNASSDFPTTFGDVFSDLFGEKAGGGRERGADLRYDFEISLEEAFAGRSATIRAPRAIRCAECGGQGAVSGVKCGLCDGARLTSEERELTFEVPAGVRDGTRIRMAGEGDESAEGRSGDFYVWLRVRDHPVFRVDGDDLMMHLSISRAMAADGGRADLKMIDGARIRVTTPPGARAGQKLRVRGCGMSKLRSKERGDLYVQLEVEGA